MFAEEGNRTYLSGDVERINWKKFDIMGEVIVGIQKSQGTPYPDISRNEEVHRLILDGIFSKDDDVSLLSEYYSHFYFELFKILSVFPHFFTILVSRSEITVG